MPKRRKHFAQAKLSDDSVYGEFIWRGFIEVGLLEWIGCGLYILKNGDFNEAKSLTEVLVKSPKRSLVFAFGARLSWTDEA